MLNKLNGSAAKVLFEIAYMRLHIICKFYIPILKHPFNKRTSHPHVLSPSDTGTKYQILHPEKYNVVEKAVM